MVPLMKSRCIDRDIEILTDEQGISFKKQLFRNPAVQSIIKRILPKFDSKGILDDM